MTYPVHTRQSLRSHKLVELKAIAKSLGLTSADARSKYWTIETIVCHCERTLVKVQAAQVKVDESVEVTIADTAEAILDELEITFIDLSIGTDLVVLDGLDAYHAVYNDRVIVEVYNYKGGYVCRRGDGVVYEDPYSAIVNQYEHYNPGAVLLARMSIERDKEIEAVCGAMIPEYA